MIRGTIRSGIWMLAAMLAAGSAWGDDWPQWRGTNRDGQVHGFKAPHKWPEKLDQSWQVEIGIGYSTPLVVGERIYTFTRREENEVVACLNLVDGKEQWSKSYSAPYELDRAAADHGKGPKSTPAYSDGRLFTFGIGGVLSAWDAKTGDRVWQKRFTKQYEHASPTYGAATSPLVDEDKCIVFVGGPDKGALTAFDVKSGSVAWRWDGDGPAYTSPIIATLSGVRQVITQSQTACVGISLDKGELLWTIPFKTAYDQNAVTPVTIDESVIFSGFNMGVRRYRVEKQDGEWHIDDTWSLKEAAMYMSSPVLNGERLYGFSHKKKGQLFALDLTTGQTLWTGEPKLAQNAVLVRTGSVLWALLNDGNLIVLKDKGDQPEQLAHYQVAETPTWAHPVILPGKILIKDESKLTLWLMHSSE